MLSATVGASVGAWSKRFKYVYPLDFDAVQTPGTYTVSVTGPEPASSPAFAIAPAQALYEGPLANTLSFYENERDGPEYIPSALRTAPAHLNDEDAMTYVTPTVNDEGEFKGELESLGETINASGGWWDAGDYLKFVQTTSYAVDLMEIGVRDFPARDGHDGGPLELHRRGALRGGMAAADVERLHPHAVLPGGHRRGQLEHHRRPRHLAPAPGRRHVRRLGPGRPLHPPPPRVPGGPAGLAGEPQPRGRDAAAFAECFQVFDRTRPELADRCLLAAEHIFELANTDPKGNLLTAIPFDFYPESEWRDDLELGATELASALSSGATLPAGLPHTQPLYYLEDATHWAKEYIAHNGEGGEGLNLYDVSGLADFELVRALRAAGAPSAGARRIVPGANRS